MFHNLLENTDESDVMSLHAGTDVTEGTKYLINVWIRNKPYIG